MVLGFLPKMLKFGMYKGENVTGKDMQVVFTRDLHLYIVVLSIELYVFRLYHYAFMNCDCMCIKYYNVVKQCYSVVVNIDCIRGIYM